MDPIWEGTYKISKVGGKGNYTLATMNDKEIEKQRNTYNVTSRQSKPEDSSSLIGTTSQVEDYPIVM